MLTFPPDRLEPLLASYGWKPHAVPLVAEMIRQEATRRDVCAGDLLDVRRLALMFWSSCQARHCADLRDWRAMTALSLTRCNWDDLARAAAPAPGTIPACAADTPSIPPPAKAFPL